MILVAVAHSAGHFIEQELPPKMQKAVEAMNDTDLDMGLGMKPTFFSIFNALSLTMSICCAHLGVLDLVLARKADDATVRSATIVNVLGVGGLVVLYFWYRIPPPLITLAAVEALFLAALIRSRKPQ